MQWLQSLDWAHAGAIALVLAAALVGVVLTAITLPGTWLTVVAALGVKLWQPELFPWWVLIVAIGLALVGEAVEFGASAVGAAKGGASRRGALGAMIGSLAGAILGSPIFFPIGTILGAAIGAAVGAIIVERGSANKTWTDASKAGAGAAAGRLVATVAKTALAAGIALLVSIAVFFK